MLFMLSIASLEHRMLEFLQLSLNLQNKSKQISRRQLGTFWLHYSLASSVVGWLIIVLVEISLNLNVNYTDIKRKLVSRRKLKTRCPSALAGWASD